MENLIKVGMTVYYAYNPEKYGTYGTLQETTVTAVTKTSFKLNAMLSNIKFSPETMMEITQHGQLPRNIVFLTKEDFFIKSKELKEKHIEKIKEIKAKIDLEFNSMKISEIEEKKLFDMLNSLRSSLSHITNGKY